MNLKFGIILAILLLFTIPASYSTSEPYPSAWFKYSEPRSSMDFSIIGAGATFPFPLIDLWRVEYNKIYSNVNLNYQSIGSGGGIKQHIEKTVNFAATDVPLKESEVKLAPNTLHIPESLGGVVLVYNLPDYAQKGLKLTGDIIADIYLGKITSWNDAKISAINPGVELPSRDIIPVRRSDGSGTTFVFTDYLSTQSQQFERQIGVGKSVPWEVGVAAAGNEGVAGIITSTPYSIGYIELAYAYQLGATYVYIRNADDTSFIEPTLDSIQASSIGAISTLPAAHEDWNHISIVNSPGENSYPISSFTYILLYQDLGIVTDSIDEAKTLRHMINWMITFGQEYSNSLLYVSIPPQVMAIGQDGLDRLTYNGQLLTDSATQETTTNDEDTTQNGGGCLVATATYGSELTPQVQMLREIRDNRLLVTNEGQSFMITFNQIYYSISPTLADIQRTNPYINDIVQVILYPGLNTLSLLENADSDSMLGLGILVLSINILIYGSIPVAIGILSHKIIKRLRQDTNSIKI